MTVSLIQTDTSSFAEFKISEFEISRVDCNFFTTMSISSSNPMFDHLLESFHRDDSNKWSNIGFGEETQVESPEINFMLLIWSSDKLPLL